ncbi:MAG TPA: hypothetical protein VN450_07285 [Candidatus Methylomirabilis sp.]|nr:hypothetical protein [Candidatus Methylomirabilis sp.]
MPSLPRKGFAIRKLVAFVFLLGTFAALLAGCGGSGVPPSAREFNRIAAGWRHTVALKSDGTVWAWGGNFYGQLGDNTTTDRTTPVQVVGPGSTGYLTGVASVAASYLHTVALKSDGTVRAWGYNRNGELGDNTTTDRSTPVQVVGPGGTGYLTGIVAIAAGDLHTVALKSDGTVWTWGGNSIGQLGDNTTTDRSTPVQVVDPGGTGYLTGIVAVAAGAYHTVALKWDGTVWGWGGNFNGQLGDNTFVSPRSTPAQIVGPGGTGYLTGIASVAAGGNHSVALKSDGTLRAWGWNFYGELGDNTTTDRSTPVQVVAPGGTGYLLGVTSVSACYFHTVALKSDGTVWTWGYNSHGQLGDNTTTNRSTPGQVVGPGGTGYLTGFASVAGGVYHTVALKSDGTFWTWGWNGNGELGDNTTTNRSTPVQVVGPGGTGYLLETN